MDINWEEVEALRAAYYAPGGPYVSMASVMRAAGIEDPAAEMEAIWSEIANADPVIKSELTDEYDAWTNRKRALWPEAQAVTEAERIIAEHQRRSQ